MGTRHHGGSALTEITRTELLLCKLIPYYFLGCWRCCCVCWCRCLFSACRIGVAADSVFYLQPVFTQYPGDGLLISTITRNQFNAAQVALKPRSCRRLCSLALFFRSTVCRGDPRGDVHYSRSLFRQHPASLFLAGNIPVVLVVNVLFLMLRR